MRVLGYAVLLVLAIAGMARAEGDKSLLESFLEDTLSGDNRTITVRGLSGALSARATIEELTISDDAGVWLTMRGAVLDWNRLALLRGRFSVNTLGAKEIIIARPPGKTTQPTELPTPEAQPFRLPELPVSIDLDEISVDHLVLAEPVLGVAADLNVAGALRLEAGVLDTTLAMTRLDRAGDGARLVAQFSNETRIINLDLAVREDAGGLISAALRMPDRPSLSLTAKGQGPIEDFTADIELASAWVDRVTGRVRLRDIAPSEGGGAAGRGIGFDARLAGDVTPFLQADYRPFFGDDARLVLSGRQAGDGRLEISALSVETDALRLDGALAIAADGRLERADLRGRIAPSGGKTVVLPMSGPRTELRRATVELRFDRAAGADWMATAEALGLARPGMRIDRAVLAADGPIDADPGEVLRGKLRGALEGIAPDDPALAGAVGDGLRLTGGFALTDAQGLRLERMELTGADYRATVDGAVQGLETGFAVEGAAAVAAADLSRFSALAGRDLGGAMEARLTGRGAPLSGRFDIVLEGAAQDLRAGVNRLDPLTAGATTLRLDAKRDETGLTIRDFRLNGTQISASGQGRLRSSDSALRLEARLADLAVLDPRLKGPLTLQGDLARGTRGWTGQVSLRGPHGSHADLDLDAQDESRAELRFDAELRRLERLVPELTGALTASGRAQRGAKGLWTVVGQAQGPSGIAARVSGTWSEPTGEADLTANGKLRLDIANLFIAPNFVKGDAAFDLTLKGAPALDNLTGTIATSGTTLAIPAAAQTVRHIDARIAVARSQATLALSGDLGAGGSFRVSGPVALPPPFDSRIAVDLLALGLTDNLGVTTSATGQVVYAGPLGGDGSLSGRIDFGDTDINLNAIGGSVGAAPIPPIVHLGEPAAVRATRARAGLIETEKAGKGPVIALDVTLAALNRVYVHGFGLQAEMGGLIRVTGSTKKVEPVGQIELIRGTLSLLSRRLRLTKGVISLQGGLNPYVEFASSTSTDEGTATIEISGPMNAPEVKVFAEPERPAEEALAMLLFGNRFSQMSPLVIAQMAASLARLGSGDAATQGIKKATGVDTISVGEDETGAPSATVGGYLSDNIHTDVTVNTQGETELNLNLDLNENLRARGTVDNAGDTALGLFFQRDY